MPEPLLEVRGVRAGARRAVRRGSDGGRRIVRQRPRPERRGEVDADERADGAGPRLVGIDPLRRWGHHAPAARWSGGSGSAALARTSGTQRDLIGSYLRGSATISDGW